MPTSTFDLKGAVTQAVEMFNGSLANGATQNVDVWVKDYDNALIYFQLQNTTTPSDLTWGAAPFNAAGTVASPIGIPAVRSQSSVSDGTHLNAFAQYDIRGIERLRFQATNSNAASKVLVVTLYIAKDIM